jgi:hypothetical protein
VSGSSEGDAIITFNGEYAAALHAVAAATSRARGGIFIRDITSSTPGVELDSDEVFDKQVGYYQVIPATPSGSIDDKLVATLKPDHDYRAGVRAEVWATADGPSQSSADMTPTGAPGQIEYSDITIDWQ